MWRIFDGRMTPGRKGAPQLPSADADESRLYIGLLLRGKLYHHLQEGRNYVGVEEEVHLLLVNTDHLTSRAKEGATLKMIGGIGGRLHLEDETRPFSRQDVD